MLIRIYPDNPDPKRITEVVDCLSAGGVVIYPTDSVYGIGCSLNKPKAIERVARILGVKVEKSDFSIICYDLSHISDYTKPISNPTFKLMKKTLPGPFTFILNASNQVTKIFNRNKKTIGIRVPDNSIPREIVNQLGHPIITASVKDDDRIIEYTTDPELIHEKFGNLVDIVIDGGYGNVEPTTVVDLTNEEPEIIRQGIGDIDFYL